MKDARRQIDTLRERIQSGERDVESETDREALIDFSDQLELLSSEYSEYRHLKLLRHCVRMAEHVGGLAAAIDDRDAAEDIVRWINRTYDNEETNRDYRSAIRVFGKRVRRSDEVPDALAWVPTGTSNSYDPMPKESDMLRWEDDVIPMLEDCRNTRDEAIIALQFEAGLRSEELYELTIGDVFDGDHSMGVHVDGKTGERAVHLIVSVPHLQRWLADHPGGEKDDWLWTNLGETKHQNYRPWLNDFKLPARRAGVDKPVTPTNFRKSNTRWLVNQGFSQSEIEDRQGRERGSQHTARYMARFGEKSSERRYAAAHGRDVDIEETESAAPVVCYRCGESTPQGRKFCIHCQQAIDVEAMEFVDRVKGVLDDGVVEAETSERRRELIDARTTLDRNPNLVDKEEIHDVLSSLAD